MGLNLVATNTTGATIMTIFLEKEHDQIYSCIWVSYTNARKVVESAYDDLPPSHPLWNQLNKLIESCSWMEDLMGIPDRCAIEPMRKEPR